MAKIPVPQLEATLRYEREVRRLRRAELERRLRQAPGLTTTEMAELNWLRAVK